MNSILVTGAAGFVGANLVLRIIGESPQSHIIGLDNMNDYYDVSLLIKNWWMVSLRSTIRTSL